MAAGTAMMSRAPSRKSEATCPVLSTFPWGKIWKVARHRPHLARALDLFALGSAAWNLRQTFEEALRDIGPEAEEGIACSR
jgi:hypothetical protein